MEWYNSRAFTHCKAHLQTTQKPLITVLKPIELPTSTFIGITGTIQMHTTAYNIL